MYSKTHNLNGRSSSINITKNSPTNTNSEKHNYGLKQNFFDPSKSSPPNDFMLKLHNRMMNYNSATLSENQKPPLESQILSFSLKAVSS